MKKKRFFSRLIAVVLSLSLICSASLISVYAASGTKYEVESNDDFDTATRTSNDYDNYGTISSSSDVDFWRVSFSAEGMANFWLGNIPSGYNYDLFVFERQNASSPLTLIGESLNASNSQEFLRIHVKRFNEAEYIIGVTSANLSYNPNAQYLMRVKNSTGLDSRYYAYDDTCYTIGITPIDTYAYSERGSTLLSNLGFGSIDNVRQLNQSASLVMQNMPLCDITVISAAGSAGYMYLPAESGATFIVGHDEILDSISDYASGALSEATLVVYLNCYCPYNNTYGNLIDQTLAKGAYNAIGWTEAVSHTALATWLDIFLEYVSLGYTLERAIDATDAKVYTLTGISDHPTASWYCGNSNYLDSTILKK